MISTEVFLEPQILLSKIHYIRNHPCLVVKGELCSINYAASIMLHIQRTKQCMHLKIGQIEQ